MFEKLKNHGVKILVFAVNILLTAIAVFVMREKDQSRLLEKESRENLNSGSGSESSLPSFKQSIESAADSFSGDVSSDQQNSSPANSDVPASDPDPVLAPPNAGAAPGQNASNSISPSPSPSRKTRTS